MLADPSPRRRLLVVVVAGAVAALVGVGGYGLIVGPPQPAPSPAGSSPARVGGRPSPPKTPTPSQQGLPELPHTSDAVVYARAAAAALFTWDTMSGLTAADYARPVIADADPSGDETPGMVADVAAYLPTASVWQQLRRYATTQSLTVHSAFVPDSWEHIAAAAAASQLRSGTVAVTVAATRQRTGVW